MSKKQLTHKDVQLVREGTKIVVPEGMSSKEVLEWARRFHEQEEQETAIHTEIECAPLDGLVCFHRAMAEEYGWTNMVPTPGFFGPTPPMMLGIPVGPNEVLQCGYGNMIVPKIDGCLTTELKMAPRPCFVLGGVVKQKNKPQVERIIALTRQFLKTRSIYQGKPIQISFQWMREGEYYDPIARAPQFWDLTEDDEHEHLVFGSRVQDALQHGLWSFIEHTDAFRKQRIPLKRGVLLEGKYGVGKTLSARRTAQLCEEHGWTFVHLDDVRDLSQALRFASHYAPAVIFAEDVDQVVSGTRSTELNEILNVLDGVDSKGKEIITVLTTNKLDVIHPSVLRPGRIDSLISLEAPDKDAAIRLIRQFGGNMIAESESLNGAGEKLAGLIPAVIREVVETSKAVAITRIIDEGQDVTDLDFAGGQVTELDIIKSAEAKAMHNRLLNRPEEKVQHPSDRLAKAMVEGMLGGWPDVVMAAATRLREPRYNTNAHATGAERILAEHEERETVSANSQ